MKRLLIVICIVVLLLNGCMEIKKQNTTEQEDKIIAEYMAKLLLKYDKGYDAELMDITEPETTEPVTDKLEEVTTDTTEPTTADENSPQLNETQQTNEPKTDITDIKKIFNNDNFTLSAKKYSVLESYSDIDSGTGGGTFNFEAQAGRKIMLIEMNLKNNSSEKQVLNLIDSSVTFGLRFDSGNLYTPLFNFMSNDLDNYYEELNGREEKTVILLFDIRVDDTTDIKSLSLEASNGNSKAILQIK